MTTSEAGYRLMSERLGIPVPLLKARGYELIDVPGAPLRFSVGISHNRLSAEQRARLVRHDPYVEAQYRNEVSAADDTSIEVEIAGHGPFLPGRRVQMPCATHEQRDRIVRDVEDGRVLLVVNRPSWFDEHRSGRWRFVETPLAPPPPPQRDVVASHRAMLASARQAQEAYARKHPEYPLTSAD